MAGLDLAISTTTELEDCTHDSLISAAIYEWQVEYARFINCSSFTFRSTHPSLTPANRSTGTCWISAASASIKLIYQQSSTGLGDAVLVVSPRSKILEEHYISKMHFSWPQVSCMSGFPARGSRAVIVSYKDTVGQIQKFALKFSTTDDAEKFMNVIKEILENGSPELLQSPELYSEISSQADAISSHGPGLMPEGGSHRNTSIDNGTVMMLPSSELNAAEYSVSCEGVGDQQAAETMSALPPSFTELMKHCHTAVSAKPTDSREDLKTQFLQYLGGTSFKELVETVENVISQLGDDDILL